MLRVKVRGQGDLNTIIGRAANIGAGQFMRASTHGVQFPPISSATSWLSEFRTCEHVYRILRNTMPSTVIANLSGRGLLPDQRIGEPNPHCVRSRARGSTSTSRFAQLRRFTLLYANNLTSLR